jgi:hypothetical protein
MGHARAPRCPSPSLLRDVRGNLGEAFLQAFEAERLTPQHMAMVNEILLALPAEHRGKNWDVMSSFLLPAKSVPANQEVGIDATPAVEAA